MLRRIVVAVMSALLLTAGTSGIAQAQDDSYVEQTHTLVTYQAWAYPWPVYFNGYCYQPGHVPTGEIVDVTAPDGWTVETDYVDPAGGYIVFELNKPMYEHNGYEFVDVYFVCTPESAQ